MIKLFYWPNGNYCLEDELESMIIQYGKSYHITHIKDSDSPQYIFELIHELIH